MVMDKSIISAHGITDQEFEMICKILGREPNLTELGMFSVMWSEHCSYKNSRPVLKTLPTQGKKVLVKAGEENAGALDIGDGLAVVFKIESHNHPSAVEPFQGAATGVGGIIRDIFTMGARPILLMDSLRFGNLDQQRPKELLKGVVAGIAHYGNCIGIPTVGGEIYFDEFYEANPLVNAFCLGLAKHEELVRGKASGAGNPVYYLGATTGRDGLGGASFASRELNDDSYKDRPAVQVGDPFMEKLLLEACLELIRTGDIIGIQDLGAAGLSCATSETASRGDCGMDVDVNAVPLREAGMTPYEIMLSESQERMLVCVKKGKEKQVESIFEKWDLHAKKIGEVREGTQLRIFQNGNCVAEIPAHALAQQAPIYQREFQEPAYLQKTRVLDLAKISDVKSAEKSLLKLLDHPSIASKSWIYEQYDHMVRTDTVFYPGHDAALVRVKGTQKGIAVSTDCNALFCYLDPFEGAKIAVTEAARNLVCSGAQPIGVTNCLNFGNPMKPEIFWQFKQAVSGLREACLAFDIPVTGGNVSFYNENPQGAIYPTPTIGVVGLLDNIENRVPSFFQKEGDAIYLVGQTRNELGGSHYLLIEHGLRQGLPPALDLNVEKKLHAFLLEGAKKHIFQSCHDLSEGGLLVALAECGFTLPSSREQTLLGCEVDLSKVAKGLRQDALLFGESQSRVLVSVSPDHVTHFEKLATQSGQSVFRIGKVGGHHLSVKNSVNVEMKKLYSAWKNAIPKRLSTNQVVL
jgi:phosphoribosylformylglycinamidine synthase